ncbi:mitochondrial inner membrane protease subunit 1-like [Olea europaea var. sylvestris]|nr:mitochondrial inner membrane protease subunit 1-like [Olea europaea var. sylvestris]XP_022857712.1 mitochondrial inner membrane protease subunit 1-like [Olea europaea var. sylvestris]
MQTLRQLTPYVKEALQQTLRVTKFFCFLHVTNTYICTFAWGMGPSMLPTINLYGNLLLAERISTRLGKVGPGDVVLVRSPENPRQIVTKRVKGGEGDSVTYLVNPKNSDEEKTVIVPKGHVWIEGDNKYNTKDSRKFGPIPYALLQGRVFCVLWPPEDFKSIGKDIQ